MRRRQLFELEDLPWFPHVLRDAITDWLQQQVVLAGNMYGAATPMLSKLLEAQGIDSIVDVCSGAGGPWPRLKGELEAEHGRPVALLLTDKFPNVSSLDRAVEAIGGGDRTDFRSASVDATDIPPVLQGVVTVFTAFHHMSPTVAKGILRNAFERRNAIGVFDFCGREQVRGTMLMGPFPMLRTLHRLRPRRWSQLLLTYVLPVIPLCILWDAIVSNLRAYSPEDLTEMVADLRADDWTWEIGILRADDGHPVTYIVGHPISGA